jgi:hypothetical protein
MRDIQTATLKAFYNFVDANQQRVSQVEATQTAVIARLGNPGSRVTELERRIITPAAR